MRALPRCRRLMLAGLLVLAGTSLAQADWTPAETAYRGWQISSSEDAYENPKLRGSAKRYPLSNLVDGDPATAWVYEGVKRPDSASAAHEFAPFAPFRGGVGQWVQFRLASGEQMRVDAVGIVNGYAKSHTTYRQNNRILRLRILAGSNPDSLALSWPRWEKVVDLKPGAQMQVVRFPEQRVAAVAIVVEGVARAKHDDLCISEVQLFSKGSPLLPRPTPYLIYSPGDECGDGRTLHLVDTTGRLARGAGIVGHEFSEYGFTRDGLRAVVIDEDRALLLDMVRGRRLASARLPAWPSSEIEWTSRGEARFDVPLDPKGEQVRRYEVSAVGSHLAVRALGDPHAPRHGN